jgi:hypothetical protein
MERGRDATLGAVGEPSRGFEAPEQRGPERHPPSSERRARGRTRQLIYHLGLSLTPRPAPTA